MEKKVLFRIDGSRRVGMGHISRCVELAKYLKKFEVNSLFVFRENQSLEKIVNKKFSYFTFPVSHSNKQELLFLKQTIKKEKIDCLIIDQPIHKSKEFFQQINKLCKTVVFDNINKNSLNANLIIFPWSNLDEFRKKLKPEISKKLLSGSQYMVLGNHGRKLNPNKKEKRILISMGGSDKLQFTEKIIKSFKKTDYKIKIDIVLGSFFKDSEKIKNLIEKDKRFKIIQNNENILLEMKKSTIRIFTFGLTTYESLFAGLPSIIISHSKLNDKYGKILNSYECINYLGYYKNIEFEKIAYSAEKLMLDKKIRKKYIQKGKKMVDGKGIQRIVQRIINLIDGKISEVS